MTKRDIELQRQTVGFLLYQGLEFIFYWLLAHNSGRCELLESIRPRVTLNKKSHKDQTAQTAPRKTRQSHLETGLYTL